MENVLYQSTIVPANESADGESPTILYVTEERNGFAVFRTCFHEGTVLLKWFCRRDQAIEYGVDRASKERAG